MDVSESARQVITKELERLRLKPGPLDAQKLIHAPALVKGLGGDDPHLALTRLLLLADDNRYDRDVDAAFYVMGLGATGDTVLQKLTDWGDAHFTDQRTARRCADQGIAKLTLLIMGPAPWLQPIATQEFTQSGELVIVRFHLELPPRIAMGPFEVSLGTDFKEVELERKDRAEHPRSYRSEPQPLLDPATTERAMRIRWRGEKPPEYRQVTRPNLNAILRTRLMRWEMVTFAHAVREKNPRKPQANAADNFPPGASDACSNA